VAGKGYTNFEGNTGQDPDMKGIEARVAAAEAEGK